MSELMTDGSVQCRPQQTSARSCSVQLASVVVRSYDRLHVYLAASSQRRDSYDGYIQTNSCRTVIGTG